MTLTVPQLILPTLSAPDDYAAAILATPGLAHFYPDEHPDDDVAQISGAQGVQDFGPARQAARLAGGTAPGTRVRRSSGVIGRYNDSAATGPHTVVDSGYATPAIAGGLWHEFTMEIWAQWWSATAPVNTWFCGHGNSVNSPTTLIGLAVSGSNSGHPRFVARRDVNMIDMESPNRYDDNGWHHIVGTYDSASGLGQMFVDGKLDVAQTVAPSVTGPSVNRLGIGGLYRDQSTFPPHVPVAAYADYTRVLSGAEIRHHYELGRGL
jgi:hypothetical protein